MVREQRGVSGAYWMVFLAAMAFGCAEDDVVGQATDPTDPTDVTPPNPGDTTDAARPECVAGEAVGKVYLEVSEPEYAPWKMVLNNYLEQYVTVEDYDSEAGPESGSVVISLGRLAETSPAETMSLAMSTRNNCRVYEVLGQRRIEAEV